MEKLTSPKIGTLNEKPLHEALKKWYARPEDKFEVPVDGSVVDIVHGHLLIEIQTKNFAAIKRKLEKLLVNHKVRLVYPIAREKWIIKQPRDTDGKISRRRSPKRGVYEDVFNELVRIPHLITNANFSLELLLIEEEEVRRYDGVRGWRKGWWVTQERRLLKVIEHKVLKSAADMSTFIPAELANSFTTTDLAKATAKTLRAAQKMVYCLKIAGSLTPVGKRGNSVLYARSRG
jgi:hypothetical protein